MQQIIAHATTFEFAAAIVVFLAGMCIGLWLAYVTAIRKGKNVRDSIRPR